MKKELLIQKEKCENSLKKVEVLLRSDTQIQQYIEGIEQDELSVPTGLENRILQGIQYHENKEIKSTTKKEPKEEKNQRKKKENIKIRRKKYTKYDVLKIAACTVFALIVWETSLSKPVSYASNTSYVKKHQFYEQLDKTIKGISDFCMTRVHLGGGEK